MTNSEVSSDLPDKPASDNDPLNKTASDNEPPDKPASTFNFKGRLRARLQVIGGALASIAAIGAIAGGLVGYPEFELRLLVDAIQSKAQMLDSGNRQVSSVKRDLHLIRQRRQGFWVLTNSTAAARRASTPDDH